MRKFLSSGLYEPPFFTKHRIEFHKIASNIDDISYDFILVSNYYQDLIEGEQDEDRIREIIEESFFEALRYLPLYFEPLVFNEKTALECGLIPFIFQDIKLLSLAGYGMNLSPKLDAYQVLVCGMIDKRSTYFHKREKAYFEHVVGKGVYEKLEQILAKQAL
jgi:hypothetical protein